MNVSLVQSVILSALLVILSTSCRPDRGENSLTGLSALNVVDLSVPTHVESVTEPLVLHLAKNACADFVLQANLGTSPHPTLKLPVFLSLSGKNSGIFVAVYQVLPAAVNFDTTDFVRQTGELGGVRQVPRVLLPLPVTDGVVDLSTARDPSQSNRSIVLASNQPILLWIELHQKSNSGVGLYNARFDLLDAPDGALTGTVPVQVAVEGVDLQSHPRLTIAALMPWNELASQYPDTFEAVTPRLLRRGDPQHAPLIDLLGQYISLAHENQASIYVPRLQPIVKWPPGQPPQADWTDFDSIVDPWLTGNGFADGRPTGFWPLPELDALSEFDAGSRNQYWRLAAEHFAQKRFSAQPLVMLHDGSPDDPSGVSGADPGGSISDGQSLMLSADARQILLADPRIRALLPLRDDQTQFSTDARSNLVPPSAASRLLARSPGVIYPSPIHDWPADLKHWIDADPRSGSASYLGIGNEQDIRSLAALAFLRDASLIHFGDPLPPPRGPADADQVIWFYPGQAYGVDHPLATLQLKWIQQAVQDYAYFHLDDRRDDVTKMCGLITRPVKLLPGQKSAATFSLLAGAADPHASERALRLIAEQIEHSDAPATAGEPIKSVSVAANPVDLQTVRWFHDHQKPTLIPTAVRWVWPDAVDQPANEEPGRWIDAALSIDIYNPAEEMPNNNELQWNTVPAGWEIHPQPLAVPALPQFQVHRMVTHARFNLDRIGNDSRQPLELTFIDGFNGQTVPCDLSLPVAVSERRLRPLSIDGSLQDWDPADALQADAPLVAMLDRPSLRSQTLHNADTKSSIYSAWSDENFYLAFRLGGVTSSDLRTVHNFVKYQSGRASGEDLCEVLIQPIYADNIVGPTLHLVCKPAGEWVERKTRSETGMTNWEPFEAAGVRYASSVDPAEKIWRGELAIPWQAIAAANRFRPGLLRFNFIQHQQATGQFASWAGPIDQSRDDSIAGLILLREPDNATKNTAQR